MLDYGKLSKIHVKNGCGKNQFTIGKFPKMSAPDTHPPHHKGKRHTFYPKILLAS